MIMYRELGLGIDILEVLQMLGISFGERLRCVDELFFVFGVPGLRCKRYPSAGSLQFQMKRVQVKNVSCGTRLRTPLIVKSRIVILFVVS